MPEALQHIQVIDINDIEVSKDRRNVAFSDAQQMAASIREHGLIQPIVLARLANNTDKHYLLVAGGHRLAGLRILGQQSLEHFKHYVIRDEDITTDEGKLRLSAVELEENLRRKNLEWHEVIEAKAKLLELMEAIHGTTGAGRPTRSEAASGEVTGFGVRKLAAMLGESPSLVSQDLQLAKMVRAFPTLKAQETKSAASRVGTLGVALHLIKQGQDKAASQPSPITNGAALVPAPLFELHQVRWQDSISTVADNSIDLIYTDLPYGVNLNQMSSHQKGALSYDDPRTEVVKYLPQMMNQAYRVLREARYAMFWFGFNYYNELIEAIDHTGFSYNPVPVVWIKHRQATEDPLSRYANGYEQAIVCWKGAAKFIRPGQVNLIDMPGVAVGEKLQNAQQPIPLVERFIRDMVLVNIGASVLDFCAGSGTTGVAAIQLGCYPILFERSAEQCLIAQQRLSNAKASAPVTVSHSVSLTPTGK